MSTSTMYIAIQGEAGSYHEQAAQQYFGERYRPFYCKTFEEVFAAVLDGAAGYGVVAIGNTIYGPINEVQTLLDKHAAAVEVIGQTTLPIHHCLIGLPGARFADIKTVHSQYMALGQCLRFLRSRLSQAALVEETDTAGSVALIATRQDPSAAAVASGAAAELHHLSVLQPNIEDTPDNLTTFLILRPR